MKGTVLVILPSLLFKFIMEAYAKFQLEVSGSKHIIYFAIQDYRFTGIKTLEFRNLDLPNYWQTIGKTIVVILFRNLGISRA